MTTTNKPTNKNKLVDKSNGWVEEFNKSFDYSIIDSVIKGDVSDEDVWLEMKKNIIVHIQQLLDKAVKEERMRFVEMIGDDEDELTPDKTLRVNHHYVKIRNKLRQKLRTKLTGNKP